MEDNSNMNNLEGLFKGADLSGAQVIVVNNGEVNYVKPATGGAGLTRSEEDIKKAIEELLTEKDERGELVFRNKKQWWAVFRVLSTFCNFPSQRTAFEKKMKELEVARVDGVRDLSYDSLSKAPGDVPQIAASTPSSWVAYKDLSENYRQQYVVADLLMLKLGIRQ